MKINKIALSALIVSSGLFIGRVSGFFREVLIASEFGASLSTDFIVLLLTTPDFLVSLLMGGALTMALIPEFKSLNEEDRTILFQQVSCVMLLFGFFVLLICYLFKTEIITFLAPGMDTNFIVDNEKYFLYSLTAIPFSLATGASIAFLNANNRFTITSLGTLFFNIIIILSIMLSSYFDSGFLSISLGLLCAAIFRWLTQLNVIRVFPISIYWSRSLISKELVRRYIYALFSGGIIFALPVVIRSVASFEGEGVLSLINYTTKLIDLPLILVSTAFSVVILPRLSELYYSGNEVQFQKMARLAVFIVAFVSTLLLIPLVFNRQIIVQVIYGWGVLSVDHKNQIAEFLSIYAFTLPFQCINGIILAVFSSRRDTKTPFIITTALSFLLFSFLFLSSPSINTSLSILVLFYSAMTLTLLLALKVKHDFYLFTVGCKFLFPSIVLILLAYCSLYYVSSLVIGLSPILAMVILSGFIVILLLFFIFCLKRYIEKNDEFNVYHQ